MNHKYGYPQLNWPPRVVDRGREQNRPPAIQEKGVSDLMSHLDSHKSLGPDGICPRVMRKLAGGLTKPLSIIYQQPWLTAEVPDNWKLTNVMPTHRKDLKEVLGNYRPFRMTLLYSLQMPERWELISSPSQLVTRQEATASRCATEEPNSTSGKNKFRKLSPPVRKITLRNEK